MARGGLVVVCTGLENAFPDETAAVLLAKSIIVSTSIFVPAAVEYVPEGH